MVVVPIGITEVMLHVADDWILPVGEINRAIRPNVHRGWAKILIARTDEILHRLAFSPEPSSVTFTR